MSYPSGHPQGLTQCSFVKAAVEEEHTCERHVPCLQEVHSGVTQIDNHDVILTESTGREQWDKVFLECPILSFGEWVGGGPQEEGDAWGQGRSSSEWEKELQAILENEHQETRGEKQKGAPVWLGLEHHGEEFGLYVKGETAPLYNFQ